MKEWHQSQVLRVLAHQALHSTQSLVIELGRLIDVCLASHPQLVVEGVLLEDDSATTIGKHIVEKLSDPAFQRSFNSLLFEELSVLPLMSPQRASEYR